VVVSEYVIMQSHIKFYAITGVFQNPKHPRWLYGLLELSYASPVLCGFVYLPMSEIAWKHP